MKKDKRNIGLREIVYNAHVSVATVSRVLNGNHRVDPDTQKTVLDAAAKLNAHISPTTKPAFCLGFTIHQMERSRETSLSAP